MDQTVHTVNDLGKCAERHQADDLHACNVTDRILRAEDVPRIALLGLVAERDALLFGVKALDVNRQRLADRDNILRLADVLPGQLGQVNHAVYAATEVNKRTVRGCALDNARVNLADFDVRPELRFLFAALLALNQTDRADCLLARFDFNDAEFNRLANQRGEIAVLRHAALRRGNKDAVRTRVDHNAALNGFRNLALQNGLVLAGFLNVLPVAVCVHSLFGKLRNPFQIAYADHKRFHAVTLLELFGKLKRRVVADLFSLDVTGHAGAKIQLQFGIGYLCNGSGNNISCI